jgi:hypothetical protein
MSSRMVRGLLLVILLSVVPVLAFAEGQLEVSAEWDENLDFARWEDVDLDSLADMSVESLRNRRYGSQITIVDWLGQAGGANEYQAFYSSDGTPTYNTYMAAYRSDGMRVYSRIDIPATRMPDSGYPVVVFGHGWVGEQGAPGYTFNYGPESYYGDILDFYVDAGFIVVMPGFRGHGTVHNVPAEGIEFLSAFDNGSYTSPLFYAIDMLNLIEGLGSLENNPWSVWGYDSNDSIKVDLNSINLISHSQAGDAALTALAVSGEGSPLENTIAAASFWSGCFPTRITQLNTYGAMETSTEAFQAGNQDEFEWNGTAIGSDGSVNPNFVFGWPPDWIGSINPEDWDWQAGYFGNSIESVYNKKYGQAYDAFNEYVRDVTNARFSVSVANDGKVTVNSDPAIARATNAMSAFLYPEYLVDEKIILHYSDQDFYSFPAWNLDLAARINDAGGACMTYLYPENNHSLKKSQHQWFDPG